MFRPLVVAAAVVALAFPGAGSAQTVLEGSVGVIGIQMPLTQAGVQVDALPPGPYRLSIVDRTAGHSFHLVGPGVDEGTGIAFSSPTPVVWDVDFTHARYNWFCDVHPLAMYGTVTVGNFLVVEREGVGTITSSPAGIACFPFCESAFPAGGTVDLVATAPPGYRFKGWLEGPCTGDGPCTVDVQGTVFLRARFEQAPSTEPPPPPPPPPASETAPARITEARVVRRNGKRVLAVRLAVRRDADARVLLRSGQRVYARKRVELLPGRRVVRLAVPRSVAPGPYGLHVRLAEFLNDATYTLKKTVRVPRPR